MQQLDRFEFDEPENSQFVDYVAKKTADSFSFLGEPCHVMLPRGSLLSTSGEPGMWITVENFFVKTATKELYVNCSYNARGAADADLSFDLEQLKLGTINGVFVPNPEDPRIGTISVLVGTFSSVLSAASGVKALNTHTPELSLYFYQEV